MKLMPLKHLCGRVVNRPWWLPGIAIAACTAIAAWYITYGTWHFFVEDPPFSGFYDAQGASLCEGRLDVPRDAILNEAYLIDGKCYGYYGISPSVLRVGLNALAPRLRGRWTRCSMLAAYLVGLLAVYLIVRAALDEGVRVDGPPRRTAGWMAVFLLASGLGSTSIFLMSRPVMYHESIIWSSSLAMVSAHFLLRYGGSGRISDVVWAGLFALTALHARPLCGFGMLVACLLSTLDMPSWLQRPGGEGVDWRRTSHAIRRAALARPFLVAVSIVVLSIGSYVLVCYGKFGTLGRVPFERHVACLENPDRLARTGGKWLHLSNVRFNMAQHFDLDTFEIVSWIPWITMREKWWVTEVARFPEAKIDWVESSYGVIVGLPALTLLAAVGLVLSLGTSRFSRFRPVVLGCLAGVCPLLFCYASSYRYVHDFLPLLTVSGAVGLARVLEMAGGRRKAFVMVLSLATAFSVYTNLTTSLWYQRGDRNVGLAPVEAKQQMERWLTRLGEVTERVKSCLR